MKQNPILATLTVRKRKGGAPMDHETFADRVQALRGRLYRTAYLYLGS